MTGDLLGQTLGSRYRFDELLGIGSFAHVFRITDLNRRATLAAKVLRRDIAQDATFLARFQREADVLARLQHPNIVRYYDIVEHDSPEFGETIFILMDYIPGTTLESLLQHAAGPLKPFASLAYLTPLAAALHFAHHEGVIHRDLKPANILIHENGTLYVTDFGIARLLNVTSDLTMGVAIGTPYYMAPEQITGDPVTVATDVYSLGIILYRMYTGYLPFRGERPGIDGDSTATRTTREQVHAAPEPLHHLNPELDLAVEEIVLRCLEKDPMRRYPSISELYDALAEAVGAPPVSLDTAPQESVPLEVSTDEPSDAAPAPPSMKLPEWSQYIPRVSEESAADESEDRARRDDEEMPSPPGEAPVPRPDRAKTVERIPHPVPQPVTRPHLEDQLQPPEQIDPPSSAARTIPGLGRILRRGTVTAAAPPPEQRVPQPAYQPGYGDYVEAEDDLDRPRNWPLIGAVVGALLVAASVCIAAVYLLTAGENPPNPNLDLTRTASASSSATTIPKSTESPDGERIAFDSRRNGNFDIFIVNVDGTGLRQLAGSPGAERGPAWSPDGEQIAFYGAVAENDNYDIYVINVDGTGLKNLTNSPTIDDKYPTWSPDGTQVAYHSNADGDYDLTIIETDLNAPDFGPRAITHNAVDDLGPDWSPEGTQIVFHTAAWGEPYEIGILDLSTLQVRRLTDNDNTNAFPTWSPDGTRIAYHAISANGAVNIYILRTDGSPAQALTTGPGYSAFPDWSPDGAYIVYHSGQDYESAIYMIPVTGGTPQALTGTQANYLPEWEPAR